MIMAVHSDNFDEIKARFDKIKPFALQYFALDGNKPKWKSDLERLKDFVTETTGMKGKWTAPGGNSKRFKSQSGQFQVTWYFKKRLTLLFEGALGEELAIRLKEMLNSSQDNVAESALVAEGKDGVSELEAEVPTSMHAENVSPTVTCSCSCREIQADMEGIKLDMVIMEKRIEAKLNAIINKTGQEPIEVRNEIMSEQGTFNYEKTIRELESKIVALQKSSKKDLNDKEQTISSLKGQLTKAEHDYTILSKQLTDITQERDSLILAFSLIIDEKSGGQNIKPGKEFVRPKRSSKMFNQLQQRQQISAKIVSPFERIV